MKQIKFLLAALILSTFTAGSAHALLGEVRANYGSVSGEPKDYKKAYPDFQDGPVIDKQNYLGVDAVLMLPAIPFGFGLRYEITGEDLSQFAEKVDYAFTRLSLILNYRIIDTGLYLGPIVTYGISHDLEFKIVSDADKIKAGGDSSYSIGVEGGAKLGLFRIGAELGYMSMVFDDLTDIGGTLPNKNGLNVSELDFSGTYYKIQLGVGF